MRDKNYIVLTLKDVATRYEQFFFTTLVQKCYLEDDVFPRAGPLARKSSLTFS